MPKITFVKWGATFYLYDSGSLYRMATITDPRNQADFEAFLLNSGIARDRRQMLLENQALESLDAGAVLN